MQKLSSVFSTSWWTERVALYGSTTVSDTLGEGMTEKVFMILSGYSSLILEMRSVPIPEPVPPPREWVSWNPWNEDKTCKFQLLFIWWVWWGRRFLLWLCIILRWMFEFSDAVQLLSFSKVLQTWLTIYQAMVLETTCNYLSWARTQSSVCSRARKLKYGETLTDQSFWNDSLVISLGTEVVIRVVQKLEIEMQNCCQF